MSRRKFKQHEQKKSRRNGEKNPTNSQSFEGTIAISPNGFGFFEPTNDEESEFFGDKDIFIPAHYTNNAMTGDTVKIILLPPRPGTDDAQKGPAGKVIEIIKRKHDTIIAELLPGNKVRPLNKKLNAEITLARGKNGAKSGEWAEIKLEDNLKSGELLGKIVRSIGQVGTIQGDLDAVCAEFDLEPPYTEEENLAASLLTPREIERKDFTNLFTVTIDPTDAKDFDDALSFQTTSDPNIVEIGVHISDVAAYITPKSDLDKKAFLRGFTSYLPGRTLPMLPKTLTKLISLQENQISCAHSVMLKMDVNTGNVIEFYRCHSKIKVDKRLDYAIVQKFIETPQELASEWTPDFAQKMSKIIQVTNLMRKVRQKTEEFLDLAIPEVRIICDENSNTINSIVKKVQKEADFVVEECMLMANSLVGNELIEKGIPGLFRIHPMPEPEKLMDFSETIHDLFDFYPGDLSTRTNCNNFIKKLPDNEEKPIILNLFLRSLPRASYSEKVEIHFGLGKNRYSHFTSPIRRYTDLVLHQQLWNIDTNQRLKPKETFAKLAIDLSAKEENNDNAFYTASDRLKLRYLQEQLEERATNYYSGLVSKFNNNAITVEIGEIGLIGMIRMEDLPGYFYKLNNSTLQSERNNKTIKIGDSLKLRLYEIDFNRGIAYFKIAG